MKICITGGAGMIGSCLVKRLAKNNNNKIYVIDNLWRGNLENLKVNNKYLIDLKNNFFNIDLSDSKNSDKIYEIFNTVDIVIHLADIVAGIGYVFKKQYEIFYINNLINSNVFRAVSKTSIDKLIYVGTACSFPLELQNSLESELFDNSLFPANPESAYGWSKLIGQLELRYLAETAKFEINTLMLHNVYGPNCEFEGDRTQVVPSLINKVLNANFGDIIDVWGSGDQGRGFIFVDDVVDALEKTMLLKKLPQFMQIGPTKCTSIKELINDLIIISEKDLKIAFDTSKPEGDKGRYANIDKAQEFLNWYPKTNFADGLKITYDWIKSKKSV